MPREIDFLSKKLNIPKEKLANQHKINGHFVWGITVDEKNCIFYKFGRCIKRSARPLDCRSYPIIPFLKKGKLDVKLESKCPLVKKKMIKKEILEKIRIAWQTVNPPDWWLKIYKYQCE